MDTVCQTIETSCRDIWSLYSHLSCPGCEHSGIDCNIWGTVFHLCPGCSELAVLQSIDRKEISNTPRKVRHRAREVICRLRCTPIHIGRNDSVLAALLNIDVEGLNVANDWIIFQRHCKCDWLCRADESNISCLKCNQRLLGASDNQISRWYGILSVSTKSVTIEISILLAHNVIGFNRHLKRIRCSIVNFIAWLEAVHYEIRLCTEAGDTNVDLNIESRGRVWVVDDICFHIELVGSIWDQQSRVCCLEGPITIWSVEL